MRSCELLLGCDSYSPREIGTAFLPILCFQLTNGEFDALRSQIVTLELGRGRHRKYLPFAFTEQGVAMLSSVLRSKRAVHVNIEIMRALVR